MIELVIPGILVYLAWLPSLLRPFLSWLMIGGFVSVVGSVEWHVLYFRVVLKHAIVLRVMIIGEILCLSDLWHFSHAGFHCRYI